MSGLISHHVTIDLRGLQAYRQGIVDGLKTGRGPVADAVKQWGVRYRAFAQERFVKFSRGLGDWPALSKRTRRKRGSTAKAAILRDTGTLFAVLAPVFVNSPGAMQKLLKDGIRVGFGGPARHAKGKGASIADIARFHQTGAGRLPVRKIIVPPSGSVFRQMEQDMLRGLERLRAKTNVT